MLSTLDKPTNINKIPDSFEVTLGIIRPSYIDHETETLALLSKCESLQVITNRYVQFTEDDVEFLYQQYAETEYFDDLKKEMISGVSLALILFGKNAVTEWKSICNSINMQRDIDSGSVKLRSSFGDDVSQNAVYGSSSQENAQKHIRYFFPDFKFQSVADVGISSAKEKELAQKYLETNLHPILSKGLAELATIRPDNPAEWLGNWLLDNYQNDCTMQQ